MRRLCSRRARSIGWRGIIARCWKAIASDPDRRIGELDMLEAAERHRLLVEWNDTAADYPQDKLVHELFEEQAARAPEAVALVYEGAQLSYGELNERANRLAHHLRALGVGPDAIVGLCVERSFEMIVALLGVLKAGGAYLPIDPDYPKDRIAYMIDGRRAGAGPDAGPFARRACRRRSRRCGSTPIGPRSPKRARRTARRARRHRTSPMSSTHPAPRDGRRA